MTLILKLDLDMVKMYLYTKNEISMSRGSKVIAWTDIHTDWQTDTQTHRQTHRHDWKHYQPIYGGGNNELHTHISHQHTNRHGNCDARSRFVWTSLYAIIRSRNTKMWSVCFFLDFSAHRKNMINKKRCIYWTDKVIVCILYTLK